jgi:hypothetical protein
VLSIISAQVISLPRVHSGDDIGYLRYYMYDTFILYSLIYGSEMTGLRKLEPNAVAVENLSVSMCQSILTADSIGLCCQRREFQLLAKQSASPVPSQLL